MERRCMIWAFASEITSSWRSLALVVSRTSVLPSVVTRPPATATPGASVVTSPDGSATREPRAVT